jgi:hypothetical protein
VLRGHLGVRRLFERRLLSADAAKLKP